jgi:hypothetical protein
MIIFCKNEFLINKKNFEKLNSYLLWRRQIFKKIVLNRNWAEYKNKSYNYIPFQAILFNVELALKSTMGFLPNLFGWVIWLFRNWRWRITLIWKKKQCEEKKWDEVTYSTLKSANKNFFFFLMRSFLCW